MTQYELTYTKRERSFVAWSAILGYAFDFYNLIVMAFLLVPIQNSLKISLPQTGIVVAMTLAGSVLGVVCAFFLRKVMASFLFGLSANDPLVLSIVPCIMVFVILLACWVPARRASRTDPMVALRCE